MPRNPAYAAAPFNHAKADIILRSSDDIDFRVFKLFLSLASPFFETLFDIPQPAEANGDQETRGGLAVIPVMEHSKTLDTLLRFCYPCTLVEDPVIDAFGDAVDVLEAARKYSLDAIEKKARQAIANPKILREEPLRCFAIARRGQLREETLLAAKYTLATPLVPSWFQEIELLTSTDLLSLLSYHQRCGDAVYALKLDLSWITSYYSSSEACRWLTGPTVERGSDAAMCTPYRASSKKGHCECPQTRKVGYALFGSRSPPWWENFMEETFAALRDKPCEEVIRASAETTVATVKARNCPVCSRSIAEGMRDFVELFAMKVEEAISKIELELKF